MIAYVSLDRCLLYFLVDFVPISRLVDYIVSYKHLLLIFFDLKFILWFWFFKNLLLLHALEFVLQNWWKSSWLILWLNTLLLWSAKKLVSILIFPLNLLIYLTTMYNRFLLGILNLSNSLRDLLRFSALQRLVMLFKISFDQCWLFKHEILLRYFGQICLIKLLFHCCLRAKIFSWLCKDFINVHFALIPKVYFRRVYHVWVDMNRLIIFWFWILF